MNEIKRMQQLAGIRLINEADMDEYNSTARTALESGEWEIITPETDVQPNDNIVGLWNGAFAEVRKVKDDKYKIVYDAYGDASVISRKRLEKNFAIEKKI